MKKGMPFLVAIVLCLGMMSPLVLADAKEPSVLVFAQIDDGFSEQLKHPEAQAVHQAILDAINVDVRPLYFPADQYNNRLNMMFATDDQLDIFCRVDLQHAVQYYHDGVIIDLTDLIAEKIPNYLSNVAASEKAQKARAESSYQGKDLGFPMVAPMSRGQTVQIRTDWLEKLGMDKPSTISEFEAYLEAVKTKDPDGNGKDDTYGLCGARWGGDIIANLATAFLPAGDNWWLDADGMLRHPGLHPNYKQLLATIISWQQKGYLPPEALLSDDDQRQDWLVNNQLGALAGWYSAPIGGRVALIENVPDAWYEPINLTGLDDAANAYVNEKSYTSMVVVTSKCKDLDAVARYFNFMYTTEGITMLTYGIEGLTYTVEDDGSPTILKDNGGTALCYACYIPQIATDGLLPWGFFAGKDYTLTLYRGLLKATDALPGFDLPDKLVPYNATAMESYDKQTDLKTFFSEQRAKVLAGEIPLENWDQIMETWLSIGGAQYTDDRNAQYQAYLRQ